MTFLLPIGNATAVARDLLIALAFIVAVWRIAAFSPR